MSIRMGVVLLCGVMLCVCCDGPKQPIRREVYQESNELVPLPGPQIEHFGGLGRPLGWTESPCGARDEAARAQLKLFLARPRIRPLSIVSYEEPGCLAGQWWSVDVIYREIDQ